MDIQQQLKELKEMHDSGLITPAVYEERQKTILASATANAPSPSLDKPSSLFNLEKNMSVLIKLGVIVVVLLGAVWFIYKLSGQETKDTIGQIASRTGIGTQVIPWVDRAEIAARKLIEKNESKMAEAVQRIAHPTGKSPTFKSLSISKLSDRILVEITVDWKGGFVGGEYSTVVVWEISDKSHVGAKVTTDSAPTRIADRNKDDLNEYFRTKVYPAFHSDIGG